MQNFLLHFWQGMPPHIVPILDCGTIVMLVGVCDSILYKAIATVLMPTVLQALPDRWALCVCGVVCVCVCACVSVGVCV